MQDIKSNLYECKHCSGTGTCTNGPENSTCAACIKKNELKKGKSYTGLLCGSCGGIGMAEPLTERMNKRTAPLLAIYLVVILLIGVFGAALTKSPFFSELLAFASAIIGTVCGHYFSMRVKA